MGCCYVMCDDGLGRCMAVFVYTTMLLGNLLFFLAIVRPTLGTDGTGSSSKALFEYLAYNFCWFMMLVSHARTMCSDPGFIPTGYEYQEEVLVAPFKTLASVEQAFKNKDRFGPGSQYSVDEESKVNNSSKL